MTKARAAFFFILLMVNFLFIDFPGAKIITYGGIILILINFIYTKIIQGNFEVERESENYTIFSGISEISRLFIANKSFLPVHAILVNDYADLDISPQQSHSFIALIPAKKKNTFEYNIYGRKRGRYKIGPTIVKFNDILGMFSFNFEIDTHKEVIVFPRIYKIPYMSYKSLQPQGVIKNKVPIFEDPSLITGLREYVVGDDVKKINWKISAKHGKYLVNTYQHSISSASIIILNLFDEEYNFREKDFYVEQAIELCASLSNELFLIKQEFGLVANCNKDNNDTVLISAIGKSENHFKNLLMDMALIETNKTIRVRDVFDKLKYVRWGLSIFLITTRLDEETLNQLIHFQKRGHTITIINTGPEIRKDLSLWNIGFQSFYAEHEANMINLLRL